MTTPLSQKINQLQAMAVQLDVGMAISNPQAEEHLDRAVLQILMAIKVLKASMAADRRAS